jgi:hypothetical protein
MYVDRATQPQLNYIASLLKSQEVSDELREQAETVTSKKGASHVIGELKKAPRKTVEVKTKPGYYVLTDHDAGQGDVIFQVVLSKQGRPYAKKLVATTTSTGKPKGSWVYAPGEVKNFEDLTPLSAEEAGVKSKAYGFCCICGRTLTAEQSVAAGIGPICSGKLSY